MTPELPPPPSIDDLLSVAQPQGKRVLILGCGEGAGGAAMLAAGAAEVVGLEPGLAAVVARSRLTAVYRSGLDAAFELPYPDGYFDLLVLEDLSLLEAPAATLRHVLRWLGDAGRLACIVPNPVHEATLVRFLADGRWPPGAGARPLSVADALAALSSAGLTTEDEIIAVRTEPGKAAPLLAQLSEAFGGDRIRFAEDLTLVRVYLAARPSLARGLARPEVIPDPWRGSKPVKVLLAPDLSDPSDPWEGAIGPLVQGLSQNTGVTVCLALPLDLLGNPPPAVRAAAESSPVDFLLTEAPHDDAGWDRLLAGTSLYMATAANPIVAAAAARVGARIQRPD